MTGRPDGTRRLRQHLHSGETQPINHGSSITPQPVPARNSLNMFLWIVGAVLGTFLVLAILSCAFSGMALIMEEAKDQRKEAARIRAVRQKKEEEKRGAQPLKTVSRGALDGWCKQWCYPTGWKPLNLNYEGQERELRLGDRYGYYLLPVNTRFLKGTLTVGAPQSPVHNNRDYIGIRKEVHILNSLGDRARQLSSGASETLELDRQHATWIAHVRPAQRGTPFPDGDARRKTTITLRLDAVPANGVHVALETSLYSDPRDGPHPVDLAGPLLPSEIEGYLMDWKLSVRFEPPIEGVYPGVERSWSRLIPTSTAGLSSRRPSTSAAYWRDPKATTEISFEEVEIVGQTVRVVRTLDVYSAHGPVMEFASEYASRSLAEENTMRIVKSGGPVRVNLFSNQPYYTVSLAALFTLRRPGQ